MLGTVTEGLTSESCLRFVQVVVEHVGRSMGFHSHKGPRSSEWIVQVVVNVCWLLENDPERMDDTRNPSQEGQDQIDEEVGVKSISIDEHLA